MRGEHKALCTVGGAARAGSACLQAAAANTQRLLPGVMATRVVRNRLGKKEEEKEPAWPGAEQHAGIEGAQPAGCYACSGAMQRYEQVLQGVAAHRR